MRYIAGSPDALLNRQWGLRAIRWFQAKRPSAKSVQVAVLDTGIDHKHPELAPNIDRYEHFGFSAQDIIGHGTHVAGTIAAAVNNGLGIAGMADCRLQVWKIFDDVPTGGEYYVDGVAYLRALREVLTARPGVLNLSISGTAASTTERLLFKRLAEADVLVCAAMGNGYLSGNATSYPAAYGGVYAVAAVDASLRRADFSNTGAHAFVAAPGVSVLSTLPRRASKAREETDCAAWDGTSMASPHVAGLAALLRARKPKQPAPKVAELIGQTAQRTPEMKGRKRTAQLGHGVIDVAAALA